LFVVLATGTGMRSFERSRFFEAAGGTDAAWQPFFLIPLLLAIAILMFASGSWTTTSDGSKLSGARQASRCQPQETACRAIVFWVANSTVRISFVVSPFGGIRRATILAGPTVSRRGGYYERTSAELKQTN
jgi:hypothetical protein